MPIEMKEGLGRSMNYPLSGSKIWQRTEHKVPCRCYLLQLLERLLLVTAESLPLGLMHI